LNHISPEGDTNDRDIDHLSFDLHYLNAIKRLPRQMNLFQKEHIQNHDLNYFAIWEPALLRESQDDVDGGGDSLLYDIT
jgi:hypothetical protein